MQDTGNLGLVRWDDPEGWYGEGGGSGVQDGEHVYRISRPPLGFSQLEGRWGTRGKVESAPEIKRPNKKLIV